MKKNTYPSTKKSARQNATSPMLSDTATGSHTWHRRNAPGGGSICGGARKLKIRGVKNTGGNADCSFLREKEKNRSPVGQNMNPPVRGTGHFIQTEGAPRLKKQGGATNRQERSAGQNPAFFCTAYSGKSPAHGLPASCCIRYSPEPS